VPASRTEAVFHFEMELRAAARNPLSAALGKPRRLRHFHHSRPSCIERAPSFISWRHGTRNLIDRGE